MSLHEAGDLRVGVRLLERLVVEDHVSGRCAVWGCERFGRHGAVRIDLKDEIPPAFIFLAHDAVGTADHGQLSADDPACSVKHTDREGYVYLVNLPATGSRVYLVVPDETVQQGYL